MDGKGGSLEIASLPVNSLEKQDYGDLGLDVPHTIQFAVDGNNLMACLDDKFEGCPGLKVLIFSHLAP